jgi:hypothetical protein
MSAAIPVPVREVLQAQALPAGKGHIHSDVQHAVDNEKKKKRKGRAQKGIIDSDDDEDIAAAAAEVPHGLGEHFGEHASVKVGGVALTSLQRHCLKGFFADCPTHASALGRVHAWCIVNAVTSAADIVDKWKADRESTVVGTVARYVAPRSTTAKAAEHAVAAVFGDRAAARRRRAAERAQEEGVAGNARAFGSDLRHRMMAAGDDDMDSAAKSTTGMSRYVCCALM